MYHGNDDKKNFVLPEDYDQTPKEPERWDQRILDVDVARLMRMVINPLPSNKPHGVTHARWMDERSIHTVTRTDASHSVCRVMLVR